VLPFQPHRQTIPSCLFIHSILNSVIMSGLDVAGVVGTWVAAGIAIIALVGVVGPILVWRASKTERHKGLAAIGTNNNGFLSNGLPVWPKIRFFQRVRAPRLRKVQAFRTHEFLGFDLRRLSSRPESPATWVQFGACLQAYGFSPDTGDVLELVNGQLTLPVHKVYLRLFCVLGRYSDIPRKQTARTDRPRVLRFSSAGLPVAGIASGRHNRYNSESELYGLTGSLRTSESFSGGPLSTNISFTTDLDRCQESIAPEKLAINSILLLTEGFMPLPDGHHVSFVDPEVEDADDDESISSEEKEAVRRVSTAKTGNGARTSMSHRRRVRKPKNNLVRCLDCVETLVQDDGPHMEAYGTVDHLSVWIDMPLDRDLREQLRSLSGMTYVPATAPWVRVVLEINIDHGYIENDGVHTFLNRSCAQRLAYALLQMPWHPEGYLIAELRNGSIPLTMLLRVADRAIRFLVRLKEGIQSLRLNSMQTPQFLAASDVALQEFSVTASLCKLDDFLETLQQTTPQISHMIGVLVLTNEEFEMIVYQSARYLDASSQNSEVTCNLRNGTLVVPSVFGVTQTFEVDMTIFGSDNSQAQQDVTIKHPVILLAALKAYLRSLMLSNCIDAGPVKGMLNINSDDVYKMM